MCALILLWFVIVNGQISSIFGQSYLPATGQYFHPDDNLMCALILWTSALGLLMGEFCPFLTELFARNTSVFYFQGNNLSKSQLFFTKFDMCINIVKTCFKIAHWQISSIFDRVICPRHYNSGVLSFHVLSRHSSG